MSILENLLQDKQSLENKKSRDFFFDFVFPQTIMGV
jgi:hypothetical protein